MMSQQDSHQAPPTWTYMHQMQDLVSLFVEICCILETHLLDIQRETRERCKTTLPIYLSTSKLTIETMFNVIISENLPEKERLTYSKYAHNSLAFVAVLTLFLIYSLCAELSIFKT